MLKVPQLDDSSFEQIFNRAKSRIPTFSEEWTDYNYHDPGITVLHTFSWLVDILNYYLNATTDEHRLKYLKLLGVFNEQSVARAPICLSSEKEDYNLPNGTKFYADSIPFELTHHYVSCVNHVTSIVNQVGDEYVNITASAGIDGDFEQIFSMQDDTSLFIGFQKPFTGQIRFFVEVLDVGRNKFSETFSLAEFDFSVFDGRKFQTVQLLEDTTSGFLKSGFITLSMDVQVELSTNPLLEQAYYVKCELVKNNYDLLPCIGRIHANCVEAQQVNTISKLYTLEIDEQDTYKVDWAINSTDIITIAIDEAVDNQVNEEFTVIYNNDNNDDVTVTRFDNTFELQLLKTFKKGSRLAITISPQDQSSFIGKTTGCSNDSFFLDCNNLYDLKLGLLKHVDGQQSYTIWSLADNLSEMDCSQKAFVYNRETSMITFGDSINGLQPDMDLSVIVLEVKSSLLGNGNVLAKQINQMANFTNDDTLSVFNLVDASGGKSLVSIKDLELLIEDKLFSASNAVTLEDYRTIILDTDGLLIDEVNIVTYAEYCKCYNLPFRSNVVVAAVKPYSTVTDKPQLSTHYEELIKTNFEPHRLLTTDLLVVSAKYTGIIVYGYLDIEDGISDVKENVEKCLREKINLYLDNQFGGIVSYGKIYSALELIKGVKSVGQLSFEHIGIGAVKTKQGDIIIPPDSLVYLSDINIDFQQRSRDRWNNN